MENQEQKKGWSWLGFLFTPLYYSGYGNLKKGFMFAAISGIVSGIPINDTPIFVILLVIGFLVIFTLMIYGGANAKKELPVGQQKFKWLNVFYAWMIYIVVSLVTNLTMIAISTDYSLTSNTPGCSDDETKEVVIQISKDEFNKQGLNEVLEQLNLEVVNVRTSAYDKNIDKYECNAEIKMINKYNGNTRSVPITYTSQVTDDEENFYVEVYGL